MLVLRQKLSDPVFLLAVVAALGAFVVQSGELGSSDTTHRLQVAHSFWTSEPPVFPQEYPEFGLHGRGGKLQSWYGMGQSLLLLPADIIGTYIERLPIFAHYNGNDPAVRSIVVSYITNILVNVLAALSNLHQNCDPCVRDFRLDRSLLSVLSLRIIHQHLRYDLRPGISPTGPFTSSQLSLGNAVPHRLPWPAHHCGEVHLSF